MQENSTIFIDDPELHLHPAWQSSLAVVLTKLALKGINIVIATHSTFTLQYLKYSVRDSDVLDRIVAANYFTKDKFIQDSLNEVYMQILFGEMMRARA
ncbi:MAG: ATP-binding protein [Betaproteobacteria bacterium AqS2]|uniref:ATP-binding protein n=1 Tax=Candidatus Amphirhobacter heronislandensis TaxID=1732024 RepID=A0A930UG56_9GAMM|nr:ATP-binding protein [Betaproteobacteria bacterium AqS2]